MKRFFTLILVLLLILGLFFFWFFSHKNAIGMNYSREVGDEDFITSNEKGLYAYISFPHFGVASVDDVILRWANGVFEEAKHELSEFGEIEINVQYNSYQIDNRFVSVEEIIFKDDNSVVKAFNIDMTAGRVLDNSEIIDFDNKKVLKLIKKKKVADFDSVLLTKNGVRIGNYEFAKKELGKGYLLRDLPIITPIVVPTQEPSAMPVTAEVGLNDAPFGAKIALTFDDGPTKWTLQILEVLKEHDAKATFCVLGNRVEKYADIVKEIDKQGSQVIGHSWSHKQLTKLKEDALRLELEDTNNAIEKVLGKRPKMLRPPYGETNDTVLRVAWEMDMSIINWNVDTMDWSSQNANNIYNKTIKGVQNGAIILFHDMGATSKAIKRIVPELTKRGYKLVTVSELLGNTEPGKIYKVKK